MKLAKYAEKIGVNYRTAWNWFHAGLIKHAYQLPTGTIIVDDEIKRNEYVVIYARVSSSENKSNLDSQAERLKTYAIAKGYQIDEIVKEIGSGVNDTRKKLQKVLAEGQATCIIVEHKDRLTRFGYHYMETLLSNAGCRIEIVNKAEDDKTDLMQDMISIVTSFCARYYGLRRSRRITEKIISELNVQRT